MRLGDIDWIQKTKNVLVDVRFQVLVGIFTVILMSMRNIVICSIAYNEGNEHKDFYLVSLCIFELIFVNTGLYIYFFCTSDREGTLFLSRKTRDSVQLEDNFGSKPQFPLCGFEEGEGCFDDEGRYELKEPTGYLCFCWSIIGFPGMTLVSFGDYKIRLDNIEAQDDRERGNTLMKGIIYIIPLILWYILNMILLAAFEPARDPGIPLMHFFYYLFLVWVLFFIMCHRVFLPHYAVFVNPMVLTGLAILFISLYTVTLFQKIGRCCSNNGRENAVPRVGREGEQASVDLVVVDINPVQPIIIPRPDNNLDNDGVICLESLRLPQYKVAKLPGGHYLHGHGCLDEIRLRHRCPSGRGAGFENQILYLR